MHLADVPVMINRVTYTGDLGYEIWVKPEYQRRLYEKVMEAGEEFGIVNFGMRALLSHAAGEELADLVPRAPPDLRPLRGGRRPLRRPEEERFHRPRGGGAARRQDGGKLRRVTFVVDAGDADVLGDEPIWHDGKVVGWVTSGGYAHYVDRSLAQGYVPKELAADGADGFEIEILGERRPAHDPGRAAVRSGRRADAGVSEAGRVPNARRS